MPYYASGSDLPLYTPEEWKKEILDFINEDGQSLGEPSEQHLVAAIYSDDGQYVEFWTEDYAGRLDSWWSDININTGHREPKIQAEYVRRNPPAQLTM